MMVSGVQYSLQWLVMASCVTTCLKLWLWMLSGLASQRNFLVMLVASALWTSSLDSSVMLQMQLQLCNRTPLTISVSKITYYHISFPDITFELAASHGYVILIDLQTLRLYESGPLSANPDMVFEYLQAPLADWGEQAELGAGGGLCRSGPDQRVLPAAADRPGRPHRLLGQRGHRPAEKVDRT